MKKYEEKNIFDSNEKKRQKKSKARRASTSVCFVFCERKTH